MLTTLSITSLDQGNIHNRKSVVTALQADFDEAAARENLQTAPKARRAAFLSVVLEAMAKALPATSLVRRIAN